MRELTVTVDDGGLHSAVNGALQKCIESGNVQRVSIIATGSEFSQASMIGMMGGLKVAAHLDCCQGPFLLKRTFSLLEAWSLLSTAIAICIT
jgi:hypothetical protein